MNVGDWVVIRMWLLGSENRGGCDLGLQGLKGLFQHLLTQLLFALVGLARVSERVWDGLAFDDTAGPDSLCEIEQGGYESGREAGPLKLFLKRSAATRSGASGCG
jgi:hypothetical protein